MVQDHKALEWSFTIDDTASEAPPVLTAEEQQKHDAMVRKIVEMRKERRKRAGAQHV